MKSKKSVLVIIVMLLLIVVGGASYMKLKGNSNNLSDPKSESNTVFSSIQDALTKDLTLACEFNDESGSSVKSYVKNGAVRVTSTGGSSNNQSGEVIIKDKKMYMWDLKTKQGFMYDIPDEENKSMDSSVPTSESAKSTAYLDMINKYKDSCKVSAVEDSYFEVPTDISFQDMSKFMEDLKKQAPSTIPDQY